MTASGNRASTYTSGSGDVEARNGEKKNLWTSMLESVSSGKRLPEKNLLVLGGTPESQREFLEALNTSEGRRNLEQHRTPPVANSFALGYTYYDVLDSDQDDTLARVSLYLLSQPSSEFASLVASLLTPETIPNTALVILLDWQQPHLWLRQLWAWIRVIEAVMDQVGADEHSAMEEVMASWKDRGRGGSSVNFDGTPSAMATNGDGDESLPLGPGEWSEPLGLPLCVVCHNAQRMESLEKQSNWKEPDFDMVLQYLRTILLRHGASLIYTSQGSASQLPTLIHSTLGITSLLKRQPLKHNVIDRDKIAVLSNWDSWGKIRVLGGGFDAEKVSQGWADDLQLPAGSAVPSKESLERWAAQGDNDDEGSEPSDSPSKRSPQHQQHHQSAIAQYEEWCHEPTTGGLPATVESAMGNGNAVSVESDDTQAFLERQHKILEAFKAKAPDVAVDTGTGSSLASRRGLAASGKEGGVSEHIGPVQFNMGGIQVDADDMLKRLKDRNAPASNAEPATPDTDKPAVNIAKDFDNDQLQNFFSGLMNRNAGSST